MQLNVENNNNNSSPCVHELASIGLLSPAITTFSVFLTMLKAHLPKIVKLRKIYAIADVGRAIAILEWCMSVICRYLDSHEFLTKIEDVHSSTHIKKNNIQ